MTGEPEPPVQLLLEDFLPYRLNVAAARVSEGLARVYSARFGLDIPGWRVIATLGQFGRATAKAIGEHSQMHKTKVSRALMQLQARGLVERSPNPQDKREAFIALTPAGIAVYGEIVPLALAYQTDLLAALDEPQRRQLDMIIDRLTEEALKLRRI
ncbi:MAG: MarR family transcriptional regulator [Methylocystis sp.]|nr:MarR family transcriptional regulator [Methylocystis sp.]MCA3583112.1 MarR family transcriptional regulator [Methylocystis sp.]MCA3588383.1 MarR family transcriptional regulator [Methylocystis sp.]MCA3593261.1 MarR family transcriptional regulator [Methylocystis sp.]